MQHVSPELTNLALIIIPDPSLSDTRQMAGFAAPVSAGRLLLVQLNNEAFGIGRG